MENMIKKEILNQYCWVLKVLESCRTDEHIENTQKLLDNFLKLHDLDMSDSHITSLKKVFDSEKKAKSIYLKTKKRKTFGFSASKFFLF